MAIRIGGTLTLAPASARRFGQGRGGAGNDRIGQGTGAGTSSRRLAANKNARRIVCGHAGLYGSGERENAH